ncbi:MAG: S-layer homology domain-containing protein [Lawsonibacter sp.]|nr:S-layer homology domain-containing protein [Lawsonibacter sp.]
MNQVNQKAVKDGLKNIAVQMNAESDHNTTGIAVTLPESAIDDAVGSGVDKFTISSPAASVTLDDISLSEINSYTNGDVTIRAALNNEASLTNEGRERIGNRPVYDLRIASGNTTISDLGGGTATVSLPYTLSNGEDENKIVIYYVSGDGGLATVPNCAYNASAHTVTFTTTHFSTYAVGYYDVSFSDVSGWYQDYVSFLAARNIIRGTSSTTFSPNEVITRAQFATILANLSGNDLSEYTTSSFTDVSTTDWYFRSAEWAFKNGVAVGSGGRFDPNASITREQMAVMLYNYAKYAGLDVSNIEGMAIREFSDYGSISNWAMIPI